MALTRPPLYISYDLLIIIFSHLGLESLLELSKTHKILRDFILGKSEIPEVNKKSATLWKKRLQRHYFPSIVNRMFPIDGSMSYREIFIRCYEKDYFTKKEKQLLTLIEEDDSKAVRKLFSEKKWFLFICRRDRGSQFFQFETILTRKQWFLDFCFEQAATRYNFADNLDDIASLDNDAIDWMLGYLILCNQPWKRIERALKHRESISTDNINSFIRCTSFIVNSDNFRSKLLDMYPPPNDNYDLMLEISLKHLKENPLSLAATCGFYKLVEQLLQIPGIQYNWDTISSAAKHNHLEVVKLLTQPHPGFINEGLSPLYSVAEKGYIDTLEYLLSLNQFQLDEFIFPFTHKLFINLSAVSRAIFYDYPIVVQKLLLYPRSEAHQYEIRMAAAFSAIFYEKPQIEKWIFELGGEEIFQGVIFNEVHGLAAVIDRQNDGKMRHEACRKLEWLREQLIERGSKFFFSIYNGPRSNRHVKEYLLLAMDMREEDVRSNNLDRLNWNLISSIFEQPIDYNEFKPQLQLASSLFQRPFMKKIQTDIFDVITSEALRFASPSMAMYESEEGRRVRELKKKQLDETYNLICQDVKTVLYESTGGEKKDEEELSLPDLATVEERIRLKLLSRLQALYESPEINCERNMISAILKGCIRALLELFLSVVPFCFSSYRPTFFYPKSVKAAAKMCDVLATPCRNAG